MIPEGPLGFIVIVVIGGVLFAINQALRSVSNDWKRGNGTRPPRRDRRGKR